MNSCISQATKHYSATLTPSQPQELDQSLTALMRLNYCMLQAKSRREGGAPMPKISAVAGNCLSEIYTDDPCKY